MRDSWPLGIMRRRAGGVEVEVETVRPAGYGEVAAVLRRAAGEGLRVVPVGGLSAVTGAAEVRVGCLALDLGDLNRVLEVDVHNLTARVQAGVNGGDLEQQLNGQGLTLGHYPSSLPVATVGGLVSTRSSGQQSTLYGNIEDMVQAISVCLPDGSITELRRGPRSAVGPHLEGLFIGAEGGLGVVLEVVLRVSRLPSVTLGRGYDFATLGAGLAAMREIVQRGVRPLVLRLYDPADTAFQQSEAGGCLLVAGVAGEPEVAAALQTVVDRVVTEGGGDDLGEGPFQRWRERRFHLSRERLEDSLAHAGSFLDTIEVAAPWDRLGPLHAEVTGLLAAEGAGLCHFSHAYPQGCCAYFTFAGSAGSEAEAEAAYLRCWKGTMEACQEHAATIGHHHGVGQVRAPWVRAEMGEWWQLWERIRLSLDPAGIMNPNAVGGRPRTSS